MQTFELIKIAFRKLKAHVYFDKTALGLRDKVVAFEAASNFEEKLNAIASAYDSGTLDESSPFLDEILNSISALSFPKKMNTPEYGEDAVISVGNPEEKAEVSELQYFIDMDISGHILGVLWILMFGKQLNDICMENARGNRLRSSLIWNDDGEVISNPALFEPYFAQYSLWRDKGLSCAEYLLAEGHDALILTLDLKRFYYKTGVTEEVFQGIINDTASIQDKALHSAIFLIMQKYTEILSGKKVKHSGIVLPIGFLPSAVLSNWCLAKFDQGILNFWNPSYYGRYVDDIIIVEKIEKDSAIYKQAREETLTNELVIDYYLGDGRRRTSLSFVEKATTLSSAIALPDRESANVPDNIYRVCTPFCLSEVSQFEFQSAKTRIIALFSENNSTALLNKFKNEIHENISEFRLMPDVGEAFSQDDFSVFYQLDNDATINKLRGVKEISIDKYELSKFLGRYRVVSSLVDDGDIKRFTKIINRMFNSRELIDNYILWERIFEIFITDKDYVGFSNFIKKIKLAIDILIVKSSIVETQDVKRSLKIHLVATLNRVLSLLWGDEYKTAKVAVGEDLLLRQAYINTKMSNKYVMAIPCEIIESPLYDDISNINFTDFADSFKYFCCGQARYSGSYEFLPYFRQAQDISIAMLLSDICTKRKITQQNPYDEYIEEVKRGIGDIPLDAKNIGKHNVFTVGSATSKKLRIAIANVNVGDVSDLDSVLKGRKPNRQYNRYRALTKLVNNAINENADMLVLPENYVPFEWLPQLASKAAREGLALVTGVEHMISEGNVYNYTAVILPFNYFTTIPTATIFFQLKKHYAPEEKRIIEGYGYKAIQGTATRPLYRWHDCYFPVYCCYELASVSDRAEFMSWADMVVAVEFNSDVNYFGSIVESLSRDLHCYFVQVNTSQYGDSRITQPTKSEGRNLISVKGGLNQSLLIGEIDIQALREFQIKNYNLQKNGMFKPTPPGIDVDIVRQKLEKNI